ncbi:hypothetical protein CONCODRAFT_170764 [Conidiobolus coronatus NRRL 28638]|uniref:Uncharacterized protein n=1 Tax=Conidiobolus coronatus (strain ATCC 28846 / CBS 209.66 / NRRL 28638) TaxID=796925 RepID=A0A137NPN8_CONC2|nr:hypothetical protein CONCODRAFT_170764 [Conidiobolus coronatus NRRL 28638]|eukprot:KXN64691.1 hypothetical protein CONCODRAFT_170764 [Conidiobolus coronatus NRRL 28638]
MDLINLTLRYTSNWLVPIHKSNPKDIFNHLEITPDYMVIPLNLNFNVKNPNYYDLELISSNARLSTNIKETEFLLSWGQLNANDTQRVKIDRRASKEVSIKLDLKLNNSKDERYTESVIFNLLRFHCNERKELRIPMEVKVDFDYDYQVSNWDPSLGNHLNWTVNWNCNWIVNSTL